MTPYSESNEGGSGAGNNGADTTTASSASSVASSGTPSKPLSIPSPTHTLNGSSGGLNSSGSTPNPSTSPPLSDIDTHLSAYASDLPELVVAACWWADSLAKLNLHIPKDNIKRFRKELIVGLRERMRDHWYPDSPERGQGYRAVVCEETTDRLLLEAAKRSDIHGDFRSFFKQNTTMWIDPATQLLCLFSFTSPTPLIHSLSLYAHGLILTCSANINKTRMKKGSFKKISVALMVTVLLVVTYAESPPASVPVYPVLSPNYNSNTVGTFKWDGNSKITMTKPEYQPFKPIVLGTNTPMGGITANNPDLIKLFNGDMNLLAHFNCPSDPKSCVNFKFDPTIDSGMCILVGSVDGYDHVTINGTTTNGGPTSMKDWQLIQNGSFSTTLANATNIHISNSTNHLHLGCFEAPDENVNYQLWKPAENITSLDFCYKSNHPSSQYVFYSLVRCPPNGGYLTPTPISSSIGVSGYTFGDRNVDGLRSPGDPAIPNVIVRLTDIYGYGILYSNGALVGPTKTDANGYYSFDGVSSVGVNGRTVKATFTFPDGSTFTKQTTLQATPNASKVNKSGVSINLQLSATAPGVRPVTAADKLPASNYVLPDINAGIITADDGFIDGTIFTDFNNNGIMNTVISNFSAIDVGRPGVQVQLIDSTGTVVQNVTTDSTGYYKFPGLPYTSTYTVRPVLPPGAQLSKVPTITPPVGSISVTPPGPYTPVSHVHFGIITNPEYCQDDPWAVLVCFAKKEYDGVNAKDPVMISFPVKSRPHLYDPIQNNTVKHLANHGDIGAVYGLGIHRPTRAVYTAAFLKNYSGFGPGGTGAIYKTTTSGSAMFFDINARKGANYAGVNSHMVPMSTYDTATTDVGKVAYGDLDIVDDTIYTVVLATKELLTIPIADPDSYTLQSILNPCNTPDDWRPFGLGTKDGDIYIGGVCSQETSVNEGPLVGYILRNNAIFLTVPLDFPRGCKIFGITMCISGDYSKWTDIYYRVQPMISDITFDGDNAMVISIRDRGGDLDMEVGSYDMLRVCKGPSGIWAIENNGTCGGVTGAHPYKSGYFGRPDGPSGGEFYDDAFTFVPYAAGHDNVASTAAFIIPGTTTVVGSSLDVDNVGQGAVKIWSNRDGKMVLGLGVYLLDDAGEEDNFGKANGLGDIEPLCEQLV
eukprot:gene8927-10463_t